MPRAITSEESRAPTSEAPTVLFLDDEPPILEMVELLFEDDFDVLTASRGAEALSVFEEGDVDIAFFDRRLPGMTGDEVLAAIRDRGDQTPIAMLSAVDRGVEVAASYDAYLTKPLDRAAVRETVRRHTT